MAQLSNKPVLSLCIPIYNRLAFLERQLGSLIEDKDLFDEKIQLIISDNCSSDDLKSCCESYEGRGLVLNYHRNEINLGADGNFEWCFNNAEGEYIWLLGSDDILKRGVLRKLIKILESDNFGLVHLSMKQRDKELTIFDDSEEMVIAVNYWITFMSANIIRTASLKDVNLSGYRKTNLIQVPAYLNSCFSSSKNAIFYLSRYFEDDDDSLSNGGYNLFQVFVENLFNIYKSFVSDNKLTQKSFEIIKRDEFEEFLWMFVIDVLVLGKNKNFETDGAWRILWKHYGGKVYVYTYVIGKFCKRFRSKIKKV